MDGPRDERIAALLANIAPLLDEMKTERTHGTGLPWSDWNQQQRDELSAILADLRSDAPTP
jgi:hypothetical protein